MFGQKEILSVGREANADRGMSAANGKEAIELLRMLRFDLVLVSRDLPDMTAWQFVNRMKTAWSWQKWGLVDPTLSDEDEIAARMLGAIAIFDEMPEPPVLDELLLRISAMNRRTPRVASQM